MKTERKNYRDSGGDWREVIPCCWCGRSTQYRKGKKTIKIECSLDGAEVEANATCDSSAGYLGRDSVVQL